MARPKSDRRVRRTQHSLHVALNHLILEKGYAATTITDITDRANVGRSTFYEHHGSKDGLLFHGLHHVRAVLVQAQRAAAPAARNRPERLLGFSGAFFEHVRQYREIHQALVQSEAGPRVTTALKKIVAELVSAELSDAGSERERVPRDALVLFVVDTLFSILAWWLERRPQLSGAEVDAIFRRLALPALTAAGVH